ncbi:MAG: hypothetical protein WB784_03350 [Rhodanobacteraceae bacterium]
MDSIVAGMRTHCDADDAPTQVLRFQYRFLEKEASQASDRGDFRYAPDCCASAERHDAGRKSVDARTCPRSYRMPRSVRLDGIRHVRLQLKRNRQVLILGRLHRPITRRASFADVPGCD